MPENQEWGTQIVQAPKQTTDQKKGHRKDGQ